MYRTINRNELKAMMGRQELFYLVEALPKKYYEEGHLPGALHMPHDEVDALAAKLLPDLQREVVVYCASRTCNNSRVAAKRLDELGYKVAAYEDGKQDWKEAGQPLVTQPQAACKPPLTALSRRPLPLAGWPIRYRPVPMDDSRRMPAVLPSAAAKGERGTHRQSPRGWQPGRGRAAARGGQ